MDVQLGRLDSTQAARERQDWMQSVTVLLDQIESWAGAQGWEIDRSDTEIQEELLGTYALSVLTINTPWGRVIVEPVARVVIGGRGRVDIYAWPTLNRVMLLRDRDDRWVIRTDGLAWPQNWGETTFVGLVKNLLGEQ